MSNNPRLPIPEKFNVRDGLQSMEISYRWKSPMFYFLAFFAIFWNGFLVFWYTFAFSISMEGEMDLMFKLFPLIHVAVGLGLIYYTVCGFLNTTYIKVNHREIDISFAPLPFWGVRNMSTAEIEQLFVREKVRSSKNGKQITYQVDAILTTGKSKALISGLSDAQQAQYIERKIERFLDIKDEAVHGEYGK